MGREVEKDLRGTGGGENMVKIYCRKKLFLINKWGPEIWLSDNSIYCSCRELGLTPEEPHSDSQLSITSILEDLMFGLHRHQAHMGCTHPNKMLIHIK